VGHDIVKDKAEDLLMTHCKFSDEESDSSGHEEDFEGQVLALTLERMRAGTPTRQSISNQTPPQPESPAN